MKYMVMEVHPAYAVVLDENGQFIKVANFNYSAGQTVTDVERLPEIQFTAKRRNTARIYSIVAVACLCLVLLPVLIILRKPAASVYITINPEVRIDLDCNDNVVGIAAINDDGADLISDYQFKGKEFDLVLEELVDLAIDKEYLRDGGDITLTMDADEDWIVANGEQMGEQVNKHAAKRVKVNVHLKDKRNERHDDKAGDDKDDHPAETNKPSKGENIPEHIVPEERPEPPQDEGFDERPEPSQDEGFEERPEPPQGDEPEERPEPSQDEVTEERPEPPQGDGSEERPEPPQDDGFEERPEPPQGDGFEERPEPPQDDGSAERPELFDEPELPDMDEQNKFNNPDFLVRNGEINHPLKGEPFAETE